MEKVLSAYERGWMEAFIDGEGSLSLCYGRQKTSPRPRIDIRIDISNTNLEILKRAQQIWGGGSISTFEYTDGNRKRQYRLSCRSTIIREILPQLNLIVKREQKNLILEALSLIDRGGKGSRKGFQGGKMRPLWKDIRFAEIKLKLNTLNKRGRKTTSPNIIIETHIQED